MSRLRKILAGRSGEGYIDVAVLILCVMLVLALSVKILPVFIAKQQLDTFATELCREAEITGRIGSETNRRAAVPTKKQGFILFGIQPAIAPQFVNQMLHINGQRANMSLFSLPTPASAGAFRQLFHYANMAR